MADERLESLRDDLRAGDVVAAIDQFDDAHDALEDQAARERALRTLARSVTARTEQSAQSNTAARGLVEATMQAETKRTAFPLTFLAFAEGELSAADFAEAVDETIETVDRVDDRADRLDDLKGTVPLPRLVALLGPDRVEVPKGSPIDVDLDLENVGARDVEGIETGVEPIESGVAGFDLGITPGSVTALPAGETEVLTVTGLAAAARTVTLEVTAKGEDVAETTRTVVEVLDKHGYLERAREMVVELEEETEAKTGATGNGQGNGGTVPGMLNKLDTARRRIDNLLYELSNDDDSGGNGGNGNGGDGNGGDGNGGNGNGGNGNDGNGGRADSIDNRIESVIDLIGAYDNQAEGLIGSRLTEKEGGVLLMHSADVTDALERAAEAEQ